MRQWDLPGWIDFAYATVGLEIGMTAEISSPRANVTSIFSGAKLMAMMESSQKKAFEKALREMSQKLEHVYVELEKSKQNKMDEEKKKSPIDVTLPPANDPKDIEQNKQP